MYTLEELQQLKRSKLQKLCKKYKLKAIGRNPQMIKRLNKYYTSLADPSSNTDNHIEGNEENFSNNCETPDRNFKFVNKNQNRTSNDETPERNFENSVEEIESPGFISCDSSFSEEKTKKRKSKKISIPSIVNEETSEILIDEMEIDSSLREKSAEEKEISEITFQSGNDQTPVKILPAYENNDLESAFDIPITQTPHRKGEATSRKPLAKRKSIFDLSESSDEQLSDSEIKLDICHSTSNISQQEIEKSDKTERLSSNESSIDSQSQENTIPLDSEPENSSDLELDPSLSENMFSPPPGTKKMQENSFCLEEDYSADLTTDNSPKSAEKAGRESLIPFESRKSTASSFNWNEKSEKKRLEESTEELLDTSTQDDLFSNQSSTRKESPTKQKEETEENESSVDSSESEELFSVEKQVEASEKDEILDLIEDSEISLEENNENHSEAHSSVQEDEETQEAAALPSETRFLGEETSEAEAGEPSVLENEAEPEAEQEIEDESNNIESPVVESEENLPETENQRISSSLPDEPCENLHAAEEEIPQPLQNTEENEVANEEWSAEGALSEEFQEEELPETVELPENENESASDEEEQEGPQEEQEEQEQEEQEQEEQEQEEQEQQEEQHETENQENEVESEIQFTKETESRGLEEKVGESEEEENEEEIFEEEKEEEAEGEGKGAAFQFDCESLEESLEEAEDAFDHANTAEPAPEPENLESWSDIEAENEQEMEETLENKEEMLPEEKETQTVDSDSSREQDEFEEPNCEACEDSAEEMKEILVELESAPAVSVTENEPEPERETLEDAEEAEEAVEAAEAAETVSPSAPEELESEKAFEMESEMEFKESADFFADDFENEVESKEKEEPLIINVSPATNKSKISAIRSRNEHLKNNSAISREMMGDVLALISNPSSSNKLPSEKPATKSSTKKVAPVSAAKAKPIKPTGIAVPTAKKGINTTSTTASTKVQGVTKPKAATTTTAAKTAPKLPTTTKTTQKPVATAARPKQPLAPTQKAPTTSTTRPVTATKPTKTAPVATKPLTTAAKTTIKTGTSAPKPLAKQEAKPAVSSKAPGLKPAIKATGATTATSSAAVTQAKTVPATKTAPTKTATAAKSKVVTQQTNENKPNVRPATTKAVPRAPITKPASRVTNTAEAERTVPTSKLQKPTSTKALDKQSSRTTAKPLTVAPRSVSRATAAK